MVYLYFFCSQLREIHETEQVEAYQLKAQVIEVCTLILKPSNSSKCSLQYEHCNGTPGKSHHMQQCTLGLTSVSV